MAADAPDTSQCIRRRSRQTGVHIHIPIATSSTLGSTPSPSTTAVLLVHPIGVGIGRWYYSRLLASLAERYGDIGHRLVFLAPDLLGSATASGPVALLNVTGLDRSGDAFDGRVRKKERNGGTSYRLLDSCRQRRMVLLSRSRWLPNLLQQSPPFQAALTNVIISSPARLPFFLESTDPAKVRKSYRTLSGIAGSCSGGTPSAKREVHPEVLRT